ncbi:hypothetical protein ACFL5V_11305 [Fibrobacterota bacterium]
MSTRIFTSTTVLATLILFIAGASGMNLPNPMGIDIDDLGWKRGWSTDQSGGPWRVGLPQGRWMVLDDYEAVANIGIATGVRIKCLFIMSEFDRSNICANYPTTTQDGDQWDNSDLVSDDDFVIMDYVKDNAAYIEYGMHGVGHEHWDAQTHERTRAEWAYENGDPWPYEEVWGHAECFGLLSAQYGLSYPISVRNCNASFYYNPSDTGDTGGLMAGFGVKYATLPVPREYLDDHGLMVIERGNGVGWSDMSSAPSSVPSTPMMTSHWANFVEPDPADNQTATNRWITWYNRVKDASDRYAAKNTVQLYSQFLYYTYADVSINSGTVSIDNTGMPGWAYDQEKVGNVLFKHPLDNGEHISSVDFSGGNISAYYEDRGYGYIVLPMLDRENYSFSYSVGSSEMETYVMLDDGTYNVEAFETWDSDSARVTVEMYGTQNVMVKLTFEPQEVESASDDLTLVDWSYAEPVLTMRVRAADVQGSTGPINIRSLPATAVYGPRNFNEATGKKLRLISSVDRSGRLNLDLYDLKGVLIRKAYDRNASGSGHRPSGVYLYREPAGK